MDRRFLACLAIGVMSAGIAVAGPPRSYSARPAAYQAEQEEVPVPVPEPQAEEDNGADMAQGEMYDGCDDDDMTMGNGCGYGCGDGCCDLDFFDCSSVHGVWARADYLGWWFRGDKLPALVTTSPNDTPQTGAGLPPNATIVIGDTGVDVRTRSGARITAGLWYDDCQSVGLQGDIMGFNNSTTNFSASGTGSPILARPFFNVQTNTLASGLISFPNVASGSVNVGSTSQAFGAEINVRKMLQNNCCYRMDLIGGYRYFYLNESLRIDAITTSTSQEGTVPFGTTLDVTDSFAARNTFNGGQLGMLLAYKCDRWSLDVLAKMAVGSIDQIVNIGGSTTVTVPDEASVTNKGGFLALGSNSGRFERTRFSAIPEMNINLGYQLNCLWRANVGYTFMYVSNVIRPGEQIDQFIDPNQFPPSLGGSSPRFIFRDSDMWVQGINVGLECRF